MATIYKGTIQFNSAYWGGWSESVYSDDTDETAQTMLAKMKRWIAKRMLMSVGPDNASCTNPVTPYALVVEDELVLRDAVVQYFQVPGVELVAGDLTIPAGYVTGAAAGSQQAGNQNLDMQLGARVKFTSGGGGQIANPMFHGIPVSAMSAGNVDFTNTFLRVGDPNGTWQSALANLTLQMALDGLGYRNIMGAWNDEGNEPGPSCAPDAWWYNPAYEMIELLWLPTSFPGYTTPVAIPPVSGNFNPPAFPEPLEDQASSTWPSINSKCRLQVRQWKSFAVLAGRWSAIVVKPTTVSPANPFTPAPPVPYSFAIRILRKCRMPQDGTVPMVSPIAWGYWWPGEFFKPGTVLNPSIYFPPGQGWTNQADWLASMGDYQFVESKKLGALHGAERGRQRNRAS